jgi:hypothetical protein
MDGESGLINRSTPDLQDLRGVNVIKLFCVTDGRVK